MRGNGGINTAIHQAETVCRTYHAVKFPDCFKWLSDNIHIICICEYPLKCFQPFLLLVQKE